MRLEEALVKRLRRLLEEEPVAFSALVELAHNGTKPFGYLAQHPDCTLYHEGMVMCVGGDGNTYNVNPLLLVVIKKYVVHNGMETYVKKWTEPE